MTTQLQVINRLERESLSSIDNLAHGGAAELGSLWGKTRQELKDAISRIYRTDFQREKWDIASVLRKGTLAGIEEATGHILAGFHQHSMLKAATLFREIYKESALRHAWILDQVTPPSYRIRLPHSHAFMEAGRQTITTFRGPDANTAWKMRWRSWMDAYHSALTRNIQLGAINDSSVEDAMDEVDATRPGSPSYDLGDALMRIYASQSVMASGNGALDVADENKSIGIKEIWQTRYNVRVCDICAEQAGLAKSEVTEDLPAHPHCNCYWRLVPASWADLLKSGDVMDQELAKELDAAQLVPGGMYVYGENGSVMASLVVTFQEWLSGRSLAVTGR